MTSEESPRSHGDDGSKARRLAHHARRSIRQVLLDLAEHVGGDVGEDHYGTGEVVESFEQRVADLLGKEAAVLMPSGTMAQQIALRIWCDRAGLDRVAFHPLCHLELHEADAYRQIHGLSRVLVGTRQRLFSIEDLETMPEPVAAILFELPQREIGGWLPEWDQLVAMTAWATQRGIKVHLDGARLWETRPFYGRDYTEIAQLFDSVYVSFYKVLGGIAGAVLAGPEDWIDEARVWRQRHGGSLVHLYPLAVSGGLGLDRHLDAIPAYHAKAVEIAAILGGLPGVSVTPDPPHTNMMHVFLEGDRDRLVAAAERITERAGVVLFESLQGTEVPGVHRWELTIGDSALGFPANECQALFDELLHLARS